MSSIGCFNHAEGFASAFLLRKEQGSWRRLSFFHRDGPLGICWKIVGQSDKRDLLICNYEDYGAGASYRLFVLTGAGVSAESGIPTFRGVNGLWRNYRIEEVASPDAERRDPLLVWEFYSMRRRVAATAKPNSAHFALAKLRSNSSWANASSFAPRT